MEKNIKTIPYTYLIGWKNLNKWYYGVRYRPGCNPSELMKTYNTSSYYVKELMLIYGKPDVIEIRKIFSNGVDALKWETKVLRRMKVVQNEKWLNQNDQYFDSTNLIWINDKIKERYIKNYETLPNGWNYGRIIEKRNTPEIRQKISNSRKGIASHAKEWEFLHEDKIIKIYNLTEYCKNNNLIYERMRAVHKNQQKQHQNYRKA